MLGAQETLATNLTDSWGFPAVAVATTAARMRAVNFMLERFERFRKVLQCDIMRRNENVSR
jgi:hypothetical protein